MSTVTNNAEKSRIIKAVDVGSVTESYDVLKRAEARAGGIEEQARNKAQEIIQEAQEQAGQILNHAREEANQLATSIELEKRKLAEQEASESIVNLIGQLQLQLDETQEHLLDLVKGVVRKIIGEMDETIRIERIVKHALQDLKDQYNLTLLVHPSQAEAAQMALSSFHSFAGHEKGPFSRVEIDNNLKPGDCYIVSAGGLLDISVNSQLDRVIEGLRKAGLGAVNQ